MKERLAELWRRIRHRLHRCDDPAYCKANILTVLRCFLRLCDDCEHCQTFVCWMCLRRMPWASGAADGLECDECWGKAHG